ncbi:MAG TPA: C4-type zinc ribbon domain-containing protein [Actinomycetota bacterium]|nr:C4-type zinc ribbon domain-containing protein [Actinomycetota bacterium]
MRGMDRLLELQELDSSIDRLDQRRGQLEAGEELSAARKALEEAESLLGELRLASDAVDASSRRLEHEIESFGAKLAAEEKRMYDGSIVNTKELEALQHEITSLKERRTRAEDELLEQMERREDLDARAAEASKEVDAARTRAEDLGGDAIRELDEIAATLETKRAERATLAAAFDEELLELYEDLRAQKRGVGAAAIVDGVCQACHEKLSAVELDKLKHTEGVKRCEYCRRIVVFA